LSLIGHTPRIKASRGDVTQALTNEIVCHFSKQGWSPGIALLTDDDIPEHRPDYLP